VTDTKHEETLRDKPIRWRLDSLAASQPVHAQEAFCSAAELAEFARLRHHGRRQQWLAARWRLKCLLAGSDSLFDVRKWQVLSRDTKGRMCRPSVKYLDRQWTNDVSIAHSARACLVAKSDDPELRIGVDVVDNSLVLSSSFLRSWFDAAEQSRVDLASISPTVAWSMKEAAFKAAAGMGQAFAPRMWRIEIANCDGFEVVFRSDHEHRAAQGRIVERNGACLAIAWSAAGGQRGEYPIYESQSASLAVACLATS
jgi:phosphopantetheinyl transferase